jgi:hypothetical protein
MGSVPTISVFKSMEDISSIEEMVKQNMKNEHFQPSGSNPSTAAQKKSTTENNVFNMQMSQSLVSEINKLVSQKAQDYKCCPKIIFEHIIKVGMENFENNSNIDKLRAQIQANKKIPLLIVEEKDDPEDEFIAVKAQQMAYQQLNDAYGYTPLTTHAVGNKADADVSKKQPTKKFSKKNHAQLLKKVAQIMTA